MPDEVDVEREAQLRGDGVVEDVVGAVPPASCGDPVATRCTWVYTGNTGRRREKHSTQAAVFVPTPWKPDR